MEEKDRNWDLEVAYFGGGICIYPFFAGHSCQAEVPLSPQCRLRCNPVQAPLQAGCLPAALGSLYSFPRAAVRVGALLYSGHFTSFLGGVQTICHPQALRNSVPPKHTQHLSLIHI